ncbi:MAG: hypothetical protein ACFB9M_09295 [Myxococcota bacterium]
MADSVAGLIPSDDATASLDLEAARRWMETGVASGCARLGNRLGLHLFLSQRRIFRPVGVGWCQHWEGVSKATLGVHLRPQDEDDAVQAVLSSSLRSVEPSREIVREMANVVLNGVTETLRRALDLELRSSLPHPETPTGVELCRTGWKLAFPVHGFRFQVSFTCPEAEVDGMRRRMAESLATLVEAVES